MEFDLWIESPTTYPHSVTTDGYLLLRCKDAECQDFDKYLKTATQRPSTSRVYMTAVRQSLRKKSVTQKEKACTTHSDADSGSEVEVVKGRHKRKGKAPATYSDEESSDQVDIVGGSCTCRSHSR